MKRDAGDMGPLSGVRVVDMTRLLPGPFCSWYLQSLGAEVIRIESPAGDMIRSLPPLVEGQGVFHAALDRGKRSVALDTRKAGGQEALRALLETADVFLESFRPGVLASAGLGPEALRERFPRLILCSITGFGQTGPLAELPGHDLNYAGYAGIVAACEGPETAPFPVQVADLAGGALTAALGVSAALVEQGKTGRGRWLDIAMTEGSLSLMAPHIAVALAEERDLRPGGELLTGGYGAYRTYNCRDNRWITVAPIEPKFWMRLRELVEDAPSAPDAEALAALFATRDRDDWVSLLQDCCVGPALTAQELPEHPHFVARGCFEQVLGVAMPRAPFPWSASPVVPRLGQDTVELLSPLGVDVEALVSSGAALCSETREG